MTRSVYWREDLLVKIEEYMKDDDRKFSAAVNLLVEKAFVVTGVNGIMGHIRKHCRINNITITEAMKKIEDFLK